MNNKRTIDLPQVKSLDSSLTNLITRSKKLPPPPLCLPDTNTTKYEDKKSISNQESEQKSSINNCCSSSSSEECPHDHIPYILPISQRSQILQTLRTSSSTLLVPPSFETKQRKSQTSIKSNQINFLKQCQASRQGTVTDVEWLDFIRFIVHKPFENELKMLLDKYKMTYFDRVNAPTTSDVTIRAFLCDMVSETLATYSTSSSSSTTSSAVANDVRTIPVTSTNKTSSSKRKRTDISSDISQSSTITINNQTKFVISYIIPSKCDNTTNSNKMTYQQRQKQFQRKYSHLFKYIPDKDEQTYLLSNGYLKNLSNSSSCSSNNSTNNICLMLYDEVLAYIDTYDLELSGISMNDSFTLSESIVAHIQSIIQ